MRKLQMLMGLLTVLATLVLPAVALACPNCQEAPAAVASDENSTGNPAAYNNSIYVMVGVPYLSLGVVSFMIYRGVKKNEAFRREHGLET
jgi:hypothetical protein